MVKLVIIATILLVTVSGISTLAACGRAEYLAGEWCCPMCGPGHYVLRHCNYHEITVCKPCTVYDSTAGLRVKRACSSTSDTLCEPLESHYCTDPIKDGCRGAVEHTKCSPGQYIKQPGTSSSDTVCGDCVGDTYSDGSFTSCRPHTQCELLRLDVLRKGSTSSDTECGERKNTVAIVVSVVAGIVLICGVLVGLFILKRKRGENKQPNQVQAESYSAVRDQNQMNMFISSKASLLFCNSERIEMNNTRQVTSCGTAAINGFKKEQVEGCSVMTAVT
ncbi:tumor necrosis factor receptor superfamily member 5-like isoform X2 [Alosa pseudoharengus]|uniref:tumor necrosis factor receptor superfamily member 5-like isoform X2 n=1 Tax=Alosa pseudoharengus TaxID=34774 RepID=UPI003F8CA3F3